MHHYVGCLFFHLKGMKKARGIAKYQLEQNPDSLFTSIVEKLWTQPGLRTFESYRRGEPRIRELASPAELNIHPIAER